MNKDRFSYEGHWFNGAHIHAGAFVLSKAVSLSSNATKNRFFFGPRARRGWPLSLSRFSDALPRFAPLLGRSTCTFDHQVQGQHGRQSRIRFSSVSRQLCHRGNANFIRIWVTPADGLTGSTLICFCTRGRVIRVNFNLFV